MKFILDKDTLTIEENKFYNSGSVDYYEAEVQFDETWNDLTIEAIITKMGENKGISRSPINNKLMLDIQEFGTYTIGFVGYKIENEEKIYQISTALGVIQYNQGAGEIETENEPIPTVTEWEIYIAQIQDMIDNIEDMDITAEKIGKQTTITITKKDGTIQEVVINDGQDGQDGQDGKDGKDGDDYVITQQDYEEIANIVKEEIDIPTTLAELSEDSTHRTVTDTEKGTWNNKAEISDIPDVSNFITKDVNNLTNYTLKTNTGSLIDLEINQTTYVVTLSLKDQDGNVISTDTIDLPLENVVVSGRYDNTTKKVILTLENGSEVDFSIADLVAGLQTEITSQNKLASDLIDDSNSGNKFVTSSEKQTWNNKLDSEDLTDYVKNTDYATSSKGGVIKVNSGVASAVDGGGTFYASPRTYQDYLSGANTMFIGKGTLENVITGKELVNKTYVDNIVGDIESLLAEV